MITAPGSAPASAPTMPGPVMPGPAMPGPGARPGGPGARSGGPAMPGPGGPGGGFQNRPGAGGTPDKLPGPVNAMLKARAWSVTGLMIFRAITDRKIGGPFIYTAMIVYGMMLSTENIMNAMGSLSRKAGIVTPYSQKASINFVPKPGIPGTNLEHVIPNLSWVPGAVGALVSGDEIPKYKPTGSTPMVWMTLEFYIAIGIAILCQHLQSRATRSRDVSEIKADLNAANTAAAAVPPAKGDETPMAKAYRKELESVGKSAYSSSNLAVAISYLIEISSAIASLYGSTGSTAIKVLYAAMAVGLAEVGSHMGKDSKTQLTKEELKHAGIGQ